MASCITHQYPNTQKIRGFLPVFQAAGGPCDAQAPRIRNKILKPFTVSPPGLGEKAATIDIRLPLSTFSEFKSLFRPLGQRQPAAKPGLKNSSPVRPNPQQSAPNPIHHVKEQVSH
jgi:hypothetical protein